MGYNYTTASEASLGQGLKKGKRIAFVQGTERGKTIWVATGIEEGNKIYRAEIQHGKEREQAAKRLSGSIKRLNSVS